MLFEHGYHPLFGNIPISEIRSLDEKKDGLHVSADMFSNWMTEALQGPLRAGLLRMSIMFRPISQTIEERDGDVPLVTVTEADIIELGPVTFPVYRDTWIGLRSERQTGAARALSVARPSGGAPSTRANITQARMAFLRDLERTSK